MTQSQRQGTETRYEWTPRRLALGALIVVLAGLFIWTVYRRTHDADRMRADANYARILELFAEEKEKARAESHAEFNLEGLTVDRGRIRLGGPAKDGIPSLTDPPMVRAGEAGHLQPYDRVIGVEADGEAAAYPVRALAYHEAVNDVVGETPLLVVYCPLCDSVSVVERRLDGETYEFGVSGLLLNSNVLLYDRTDDALWSQLGFTAISGPNAGRSLPHLPWRLTTFAEWRDAYPESAVMTFNTGYRRDYGRLPYAGYSTSERLMFPVEHEDDRLDLKTRVVGVKIGGTARAYPVDEIREAPDGVLGDTIEGREIVLEADGTTSAVVTAPEDALVAHTFWFAWAAFHPDTGIYGR